MSPLEQDLGFSKALKHVLRERGGGLRLSNGVLTSYGLSSRSVVEYLPHMNLVVEHLPNIGKGLGLIPRR